MPPVRTIKITKSQLYDWIRAQPPDREVRMFNASGWISNLSCGCLLVEFVRDYCKQRPDESFPGFIACGWTHATLHYAGHGPAACDFDFSDIQTRIVAGIYESQIDKRQHTLTFGDIQNFITSQEPTPQ